MTITTILFIIGALVILYLGIIIGKQLGKLLADKKWQQQLPKIREDATKRSRAVLSGQFSEQLAPFLPDFPFNPSEAKFLGKPIDFLIFKGMDDKQIDEVVFVEVKSGASKLNTAERSLRDAINNKRVSWHEYRIPEKITKKQP